MGAARRRMGYHRGIWPLEAERRIYQNGRARLPPASCVAKYNRLLRIEDELERLKPFYS